MPIVSLRVKVSHGSFTTLALSIFQKMYTATIRGKLDP